MRGMTKVDVVRLLLICQPINFLILADKFGNVLPFLLAFSENLPMTDHTIAAGGQSGECPIRAEVMTDGTVQRRIFKMRFMAELHRLLLSAEH